MKRIGPVSQHCVLPYDHGWLADEGLRSEQKNKPPKLNYDERLARMI
jgi:hypothetical protein